MKGFTEALVTDFRVNAPHLRASVVMPGHIGTSIVFNSGAYFGRDPKSLGAEQVAELREQLARRRSVAAPPTRTSASSRSRWRRGSATTPRRPPPRRPRSSSTACAPASGASSSATTPTHIDELVREAPDRGLRAVVPHPAAGAGDVLGAEPGVAAGCSSTIASGGTVRGIEWSKPCHGWASAATSPRLPVPLPP